jgi:hypothetical protein
VLNIRRLAVAGVAVFATLGLAAGCSGGMGGGNNVSGTPGNGAPSSAAPEAKTVLLASTKQLAETSYHYTITSSGLSGTGAADPATKSLSMSMSGSRNGASSKIDLIKLGTDMYVKLDIGQLGGQLGVSPDKWMHLDASTFGVNDDLLTLPGGDPSAVNGLLAGVVNVQTSDGRTLTGTLDLTKATGSSTPSSDALSQAGDKAKAVPFTAVLDDQGRMTSLEIDGSGIQDGLTIQMTFSDYGAPAGIAKPDPASVVEAPDAVTQMLKK